MASSNRPSVMACFARCALVAASLGCASNNALAHIAPRHKTIRRGAGGGTILRLSMLAIRASLMVTRDKFMFNVLRPQGVATDCRRICLVRADSRQLTRLRG